MMILDDAHVEIFEILLLFQATYYMEYFTKISTDLTSFISGGQAANLFKKSNLSLDELCVIWELADLDKGKLLNHYTD